MGMAKYFEDNMEIIEERFSNCSYYNNENNYSNLMIHSYGSNNTLKSTVFGVVLNNKKNTI